MRPLEREERYKPMRVRAKNHPRQRIADLKYHELFALQHLIVELRPSIYAAEHGATIGTPLESGREPFLPLRPPPFPFPDLFEHEQERLTPRRLQFVEVGGC
jgi:hypothetical protein